MSEQTEGEPDQEDDSVVALFPEIGEPAVRTKGSGWRACKHPGIDLDMDERQAVCRKCEETVSVFDWLAEHLGKPFGRMWENYRSTKADLTRRRRELDDLMRRVQNAKAQCRRWEAKAKEAAAKCDKPVMPCD